MHAVIQAYERHPSMRQAYLRLNHITHVEAWPSDHGYCPSLCSGPGVGFPEHEIEFRSIQQVGEWAEQFAPEVPFTGTDDIPLESVECAA